MTYLSVDRTPELGEVTITSLGPDGAPVTQTLPFYSCGHCSTSVIMHPARKRERLTCRACNRWLCEGNALCQHQCTPLYSLAKDHFEGAGRHGALVPAIMAGETSLEGAVKKGLILP